MQRKREREKEKELSEVKMRILERVGKQEFDMKNLNADKGRKV